MFDPVYPLLGRNLCPPACSSRLLLEGMDYVTHDLVVVSIWIALMHVAGSTTSEPAHILHLCLVHPGGTVEQASSIIMKPEMTRWP